MNEPLARKIIKAEVARFVKTAEDRGAMEAAKVNREAMAEFQRSNP